MNLLIDLLFPKKCVGCKKFGTYFCSGCIGQITQKELICPLCTRPSVGGVVHPLCKRRYGLDGLWSMGTYQVPLRGAIQQLKYGGVGDLGEVLADLMVVYWARYQPFVLDQIKKTHGEGWLVSVVPIHWMRENKRGFNQSQKFAELFASRLGLTFANTLIRQKQTKFQARLSRDERRQNIKNVFSPTDKQFIAGKSILLIDDVWTTGATMRECAFTLKRTGAQVVWGLTLAR